jgi:predicted HTH transcriptional regulator
MTLDTSESHLNDWLRFFLLSLVSQKDALARKVERERLMTTLSELDERILDLARQHGRLTLSEAAAMTRANRNTLKVHLRQLVDAGRLRLMGRGRASWYEAA